MYICVYRLFFWMLMKSQYLYQNDILKFFFKGDQDVTVPIVSAKKKHMLSLRVNIFLMSTLKYFKVYFQRFSSTMFEIYIKSNIIRRFGVITY